MSNNSALLFAKQSHLCVNHNQLSRVSDTTFCFVRQSHSDSITWPIECEWCHILFCQAVSSRFTWPTGSEWHCILLFQAASFRSHDMTNNFLWVTTFTFSRTHHMMTYDQQVVSGTAFVLYKADFIPMTNRMWVLSHLLFAKQSHDNISTYYWQIVSDTTCFFAR